MTIERSSLGPFDVQVDVVVVGAGGCGMVAALAAARQGAQVLLLEKDRRVGGNTAMSTGMVPAAGTRFQRDGGIEDSAKIMARDILAMHQSGSNPEITQHLCGQSASLVEWLVDELGVTLEVVTEFNYRGHSRHRMHAPPDRSGATLSQKLAVALERERSIELVCEAPVHSLVIDEQGAVVGVALERSGTQWVRCQGVILASCGFGANPEMVANYCPEILDATYFGAAGNTGEAIRWAVDLGAATENMTAYQGHASLAHPHGTLLTWGVIIQGGFLVNQSGQRFGNENEGYSGFAVQVLGQPQGLAFAIFDEPIYLALVGFADFAALVETGGIRKADSIEELAGMLDIDGGKLSQTLHKYAEAARGGQDEFGRPDIVRSLSPPYCGVQVTAALFHTQGGVCVDRNARVLRSDGSPIPQLYAGGGVAAGISGSGASGYLAGNGLLAALGLGRIAGEHAAISRDHE